MRQLYVFMILAAIAIADDTKLEEVLHAANNQFTSNFFSEVVKDSPEKSIIVSAYSVMTPLALLGLASVGPSHDELLNALGLPNDNITKSVFSLADAKLRSIKGVELKTANKVYIPLGYDLNPEFAAVSRQFFNSDVQNVNFSKSVETAKEINDWVEDHTSHRIKDLVKPDSIGDDTRAILVNALYFKGTWVTTFSKSLTRDRDFYLTEDKAVKIPMMNNKADYKYGESERLQSKILEMPYVGEQMSLMIVLPYDIDGIKNLLDELKNLSILDEETKHMIKVKVDWFIPKFKIETTTDLKVILQKMNIKKLFSAREAKLDKLLNVNKNLYVSSATQKAFIEVNEEGAEAAAANQFAVEFFSPMIAVQEFRFAANHPFLFLLKERDNILFSGIYYGPT